MDKPIPSRDELQATIAAARKRAEEKLNRELRQLQDDMEASRCTSCGFTCGQHQYWCARGKR